VQNAILADGGRQVKMFEGDAEIVEIKQETHDVKTFVMKTGKNIAFVPGQYCIVSMPDHQEFSDEARPFTFSNIPQEDHTEITVKKTGSFTGAMHQLQVGAKLRLKGPLGEELNFDESVKDDVVFVAGGSGITPFMSAIRYAVSKEMPNRIVLLNSNDSVDDIIYKDELDALSQNENITVTNTLSMSVPEGWHGLHGRIDKDMILAQIDQPAAKLWYVCGPPPMVQDLNDILLEIGLSEDKIKSEEWQILSKNPA
jgi:ferredoxin-NADP reductase